MVTKKTRKKVTKKATKKTRKKVKNVGQFRKELTEGDFTFTPQSKPLGWGVKNKKGQVLGTIISSKEKTGRTCFEISGDKSGRTYRGKILAANALQQANVIVATAKTKKLSPVETVLYAWDHREPASKQWTTNGAKKSTKKKVAKKKSPRKRKTKTPVAS